MYRKLGAYTSHTHNNYKIRINSPAFYTVCATGSHQPYASISSELPGLFYHVISPLKCYYSSAHVLSLVHHQSWHLSLDQIVMYNTLYICFTPGPSTSTLLRADLAKLISISSQLWHALTSKERFLLRSTGIRLYNYRHVAHGNVAMHHCMCTRYLIT